MTQGFFNQSAYNHNNNITVSVAQLHQQATAGLEKAYQKLKVNGATSRQFNACSEDGLLGSLLMNMLCANVFAGLMIDMPGGEMIGDLMQNQTLCAAFDAASMVADEDVRARRFRRLEGYPEGRRQSHVEAPVNHTFNLVAANENSNFTYDPSQEIALLSELLDILDDMMKNDVRLVSVDKKASVYKTLKKADQQKKRNQAMEILAVPMRKAA